jgi:hypothetical protein
VPEQITAYVAVTDREWFDTLGAQGTVDEVNFWQPSASARRGGEGSRIGPFFDEKI